MLGHHDIPYRNLLVELLTSGEDRPDRTGVGTISKFGHQMRFNLANGFPLLTTKKLHWKSIVWELIWFLEGRTDVQWLEDRGVSIWREWKKPDGTVGPLYGANWRSWGGEGGIDQLANVVRNIKQNPTDRRHVVSAWNVEQLPLMALPPCHLLFQFYVRQGIYLDCQMYQRSVDTFLGLPFNIASYSLLIHIIARITDLKPGELVWVGGDVHLYQNHVEQALLQLRRAPRLSPKLSIVASAPRTLEGWTFDDFVLDGYDPYPAIKAPIAV